MADAETNFSFQPWNTDGAVSYKKYDVIYGSHSTEKTYYYALTDIPLGQSSKYNPTGFYEFNTQSFEYQDDVAKMNFTQTGDVFFHPGSLVLVFGSRGYTGMVLDAGSGYITFPKPAWNETGVYNSLITAYVSPVWTTGFFFQPSYSTKNDPVINSKEVEFGDGYSQRVSQNINTSRNSFSLNFENRHDKETRAIMNFVESKRGVESFYINFKVNNLYNKPNLKYIAQSFSHNTNSYNLNNLTVNVKQVFDV